MAAMARAGLFSGSLEMSFKQAVPILERFLGEVCGSGWCTGAASSGRFASRLNRISRSADLGSCSRMHLAGAIRPFCGSGREMAVKALQGFRPLAGSFFSTAPEEVMAAFISRLKDLASSSSSKGQARFISSTKGQARFISSTKGQARFISSTKGLEVSLECAGRRGAGTGFHNRGVSSRCSTRNSSQYICSRTLFVPPNCCGANASKMTTEEKLAAERMLLDTILQVMVDSWTNIGVVKKRMPVRGPYAEILDKSFAKFLGLIINGISLFFASMAYLALSAPKVVEGTGDNGPTPPPRSIPGLIAAFLKPPAAPAPPVAHPAISTVVIVLGKGSPGFFAGQALPGLPFAGQALPGLYVPVATPEETPQEQGDNPQD